MNIEVALAYMPNKRVASRMQYEMARHADNPKYTPVDAFNDVVAFHEQYGFFRPSIEQNIRSIQVAIGHAIEAGPDEPHKFRYAGKRYKAVK